MKNIRTNEVKSWGGWVSVIAALFVGVKVTVLAIDSNKNIAFQGVAEACKTKKPAECNELIKFGVSPELYLSNKDYRKAIDIKAIEENDNNSAMASSLAEFTLEYVGDKKVQLTVRVIEELKNLVE